LQTQRPKQQLFEQVAQALRHAHELELPDLLAQGERSVEVLANVGSEL